MNQVGELIRQIAGTAALGQLPTLLATVREVRGGLCTVEAKATGVVFDDVRLQAAEAAAGGVLLSPKAGSDVLVAFFGKQPFVVLAEQVDGVAIQIGDTTVQADEQGIQLARAGANVKDILLDFIAEVQKIIVVSGTGPNVPALEALKTKVTNVLR